MAIGFTFGVMKIFWNHRGRKYIVTQHSNVLNDIEVLPLKWLVLLCKFHLIKKLAYTPTHNMVFKETTTKTLPNLKKH